MNMTTDTHAPTSAVDEVLHETEIGSFIARNKGFVIGAVVGVLLAIIGFGIYKQSKDKTNDKFNATMFEFRRDKLAAYDEGVIKSDELLNELDKVAAQVGSYKGLNILLVNVSDAMTEKKELDSALMALNKAVKVDDPYTEFFMASRKSVILEDLNRPAEALAALEGLSDPAKKLLEGKVYFDMGRLQLKTGDKTRARASFEYLQGKVVQDEFSKMAKFYLYQMDKENGAIPTESNTAAPANTMEATTLPIEPVEQK